MKQKRVFVLGLLGIALAIFLMWTLAQETAAQQPAAQKPTDQQPSAQALPPARKIAGITAADPVPHACPDCHINYVDRNLDVRFSTLLNRWSEKVEPQLLAKAQASSPPGLILQGKHPRVTGIFNNIPANCLACHSKTSTTSPPFANLIHNIHLTGGDENHFLTIFQGECTFCHKLDLKTGHWTIPSGPEK